MEGLKSGRAPVRLDNVRVWRTYVGGRMLDEFHGSYPGNDGHYPEEWITSLVEARNAGAENGGGEGLSHIKGRDMTLKELLQSAPESCLGAGYVKSRGTDLGVLVKLIDSAERLAIQVHPDRKTAEKLFRSPYGKTECWYILGGRRINGQEPCVYVGFKEGITREHWIQLFERQDIEGMLGCLHRFEVKKGDTILIEGGIPHAIGAGCFLAEIQEPTDYTIRAERITPSGYRVKDELCHQGLGFQRMFDCFQFTGLSREETRRQRFLPRQESGCYRGGRAEILVGYDRIPFFAMDHLELLSGEEMAAEDIRRYSGLYILEGEGEMEAGEESTRIRKGEQYFLPRGLHKIIWRADKGGKLKMIRFFGPKT